MRWWKKSVDVLAWSGGRVSPSVIRWESTALAVRRNSRLSKPGGLMGSASDVSESRTFAAIPGIGALAMGVIPPTAIASAAEASFQSPETHPISEPSQGTALPEVGPVQVSSPSRAMVIASSKTRPRLTPAGKRSSLGSKGRCGRARRCQASSGFRASVQTHVVTRHM